MGVNVETWRARIGCFSCGGKLKGPKMAAITVSMSPVSERAFVALVVILALLILGGIEQNPGPGPDSTRQNSTRQQRITKKGELEDWKKCFDELKGEIDFLKRENKQLYRRIDFLEKQSKSNNIIIHGIDESDDEICEDKIKLEISNKLSIDLNEDDVEISRRLGRKSPPGGDANKEVNSKSADNNKEVRIRPILCKFTSIKVRDMILAKVKESIKNKTTRTVLGNTKFSEDFTESVRDTRRKLIPFMIKLRDSNKDDKEYKCYLRYDKLSAGGLLYRLNDKQDNIVTVGT